MTTVLPAQRFVGASVPRSEDRRILTGSRSATSTTSSSRHAPRRVRAQPGRPRAASRRSTSAKRARCPASSPSTPAPTSRRSSLPVRHRSRCSPGCRRRRSRSSPPTRSASSATRSRSSIAETRYVAEDGAELVEVDYDDLRPVAVVGRGARPDQPADLRGRGQQRPRRTGAPRATATSTPCSPRPTASSAPRIDQHRHQNVPMECRGSVADFDPDTGMLTVHGSNQGVHLAKMTLCGPARASRPTRCACSAATSAARSA